MRKFLAICMALWLLAGVAAMAQDAPRAELFGGYSYMRMSAGSAQATNSNGWAASGAGYFNNHVGIVADFSGNYKSLSGVNLNVYSMMFGPQVALHSSDSIVSPFGRVLLGVMHAGAGFGGATGSESDWAYGFGGGVDVKVRPHIALRVVQVDYLRSHFLNHHQNQARVAIGIVIRGGGQ